MGPCEAEANFAKHRVRFAEALTVFDGAEGHERAEYQEH